MKILQWLGLPPSHTHNLEIVSHLKIGTWSQYTIAAFTNVPSDFDKYHKSEASYHGNLIVE